MGDHLLRVFLDDGRPIDNVLHSIAEEGHKIAEPAKVGRLPVGADRETLIMAEKHYRSVVKAVSWRFVGTLDTIGVSFLITGRITLALSIGAVELITKVVLYYAHERVWNKIPLGRYEAPKDYEI